MTIMFTFQIEYLDLGDYVLEIYDGDSRNAPSYTYHSEELREPKYQYIAGPDAVVVMSRISVRNSNFANTGRGFFLQYHTGQFKTYLDILTLQPLLVVVLCVSTSITT